MKENKKVEIGDEKISDEIERIEDKKLLLEGLNEVAAEKEESVSPVLIGNHEQNVLSELSPEEEKLVEDVQGVLLSYKPRYLIIINEYLINNTR